MRFVWVLYIFSVLLPVNLCSCKHEHIFAGLGSGCWCIWIRQQLRMCFCNWTINFCQILTSWHSSCLYFIVNWMINKMEEIWTWDQLLLNLLQSLLLRQNLNFGSCLMALPLYYPHPIWSMYHYFCGSVLLSPHFFTFR